jgi:hypothetical protein
MYNTGDLVDIVYTAGDYTNGIGLAIVRGHMKGNPHIVEEVGANWVILKGSHFLWGYQILELANREPDWEI